jgi:alkylated DNA repair dioxygenase AlkB
MTVQTSLFTTPPDILFDLPDAQVRYFPNFIQNQQSYYQRLLTELNWQQDTLFMYGKAQLIPRLNAWYGDSDASYSYSGIDLVLNPWTEQLLILKELVERETGKAFNSVLANYYRTGQDSVAWHSDDEPELGADPVIASLSFGATRRFSLKHKYLVGKNASLSVNLEGGSLLTMAGKTQTCWQHQLVKTAKPVAGRINLTFRRVRQGK